VARRALAVLAAACVAGCGTLVGADGRSRYPAVELRDVPFFAQEAFQCGPAALATVLVASGEPASPAALAPESYLPSRRGALQLELIATARRHHRIAYELPPTIDAIVAELSASHAVLVLQNFGSRASPRWHYAVVVGYEPVAERVILRSGRERRERMPLGRFAATWDRAGRWAMLVLDPSTLPADDDAPRYVAAVAAVEAAGDPDTAARAYRTALVRWPGAARAWLGLGNIAAARAAWTDAEGAYRHALDRKGDDAATRNNLALALSEQGCRELALEQIAQAARVAGDGPLAAEVALSRTAIEARAADAATCGPR
jgi:hypothetical protein